MIDVDPVVYAIRGSAVETLLYNADGRILPSYTPAGFLDRLTTGQNFQNVILFFNVFRSKYNISVWNWVDTIPILSAMWLLLAWCFSTRVAVATALITHLCVSSRLWVNHYFSQDLLCK